MMCQCGDLHPRWISCDAAYLRDTPLHVEPRELDDDRRERERSQVDFLEPFKEGM